MSCCQELSQERGWRQIIIRYSLENTLGSAGGKPAQNPQTLRTCGMLLPYIF